MRYCLLLLTFITFQSIACTIDVVIAEGSSIQGCQGSSLTLNAQAGFIAYAWTGPQSGNQNSITITTGGEYVVTAVDGVGCVSTDTIDVTFIVVPNPVITSTEGNIICSGQSTVLNVAGAFDTYLWSTGANSPSITVNQAGTYSVLVTDGNGCSRNASLFISTPNFDISASDETICLGNTTIMLATGAATYSWSTGDVTSSILVAPETTTTYTVDLTMGPCTETLTQTITVVEVENTPIVDYYFVQGGTDITLEGPNGYLSYDWQPPLFLSSNQVEAPVFNGTATTEYVVTSTHSLGCTRTDQVRVEVVNLSIPTGFSPNGDGINDFFVIPELDSNYSAAITVFNRWGNVVFESSAYTNNWNGNCLEPLCLGKQILPDGTYFYEIRIEDIIFKGYTTIKR